jgi:hypothetical protein
MENQRITHRGSKRFGFAAGQQRRNETAVNAYRRWRQIAHGLAHLAPSNADFKRDLAWFASRLK